ncbi:unnamed protein product [Closterium sp. NIES-65]|nr:unnamed protein product [Closterium sp. NIES-65]
MRGLSQPGGPNGGGYLLKNYESFAITVGAILLCGILNSFSIKFIGRLAVVSAVYRMGLAIVIMILLPSVAPVHQSASFVFTHHHVQLDVSLLPTMAYAFIAAMQLSQYSLYAYDTAYAFIAAMQLSQYSLYAYDTVAHMAEETKRSDRASPASMVLCLSAVSLLAWGLLVAFTFCIQNDDNLTSPDSVTAGNQILVTIIWEAFFARFGSGTGAVVVLSLIYIAFLFGVFAGILGASRAAYAISRDKGLPFAFIWRRVNRDKTPIYSVWLCCGVAILFSLPLLKDSFLFSAITSLATVAWVGGYAVPIFFRLIQREEDFEPGPFYLSKYVGVWGRKLINIGAILFVLETVHVSLAGGGRVLVHVSLAGGGRVLVWWVTSGSTPASVEYGESRGKYTKTASGSVTRYTLNGYTSGYIHKVLLGRPRKDGVLKPGTTYYYRLGGAGPARAFKTPPPSSQPISVALVADMGSAPPAAATISRLSRTPHALVVFPGDLSYANGYQPDWDTWQSLIQPASSLRPWMMAPGNHEDEEDEGAPSSNPFKAYNARWPMPAAASGSPSNLYYSFDSGSIHWVVLSCYSDYSQGSAQYNWLQADLAKVDRKVTPWLIAAFHEPWYHSNKDHHKSGEDMRLALEKLLYAAHTDVVVCGHVHAYERTLLASPSSLSPSSAFPCPLIPLVTTPLSLSAHIPFPLSLQPVHAMLHLTADVACVVTSFSRCYKTSLSPPLQPSPSTRSFLSPKPVWSAFRQAAYGFGVLSVGGGASKGEAVWRWRRNSDAVGVVADEASIISHASSKAPAQCRPHRVGVAEAQATAPVTEIDAAVDDSATKKRKDSSGGSAKQWWRQPNLFSKRAARPTIRVEDRGSDDEEEEDDLPTVEEMARYPEVAFAMAHKRFKTSWESSFPWLILTRDDVGFPILRCSTCLEHGAEGAKTAYGKGGSGGRDMQKDSIRTHQRSTAHQDAHAEMKAKESRKLRQALLSEFEGLDRSTLHIITALKTTVYICKSEAPITSYVGTIKFMADLGVDITVVAGEVSLACRTIEVCYVDCEDRFGNEQSPLLCAFLKKHGNPDHREVTVKGVDQNGDAAEHKFVLHERKIPGHTTGGDYYSCKAVCQEFAKACVERLEFRLEDLNDLAGSKLFRPSCYRDDNAQRMKKCREWLGMLDHMFHRRLPGTPPS